MANQSDNKYGKIISQTLVSLISSVLEHNDKTKKKIMEIRQPAFVYYKIRMLKSQASFIKYKRSHYRP